MTDGKIIDVFTTEGLPKPDASILSHQFPAEVRGMKDKNVAAELLVKLLKDEIKARSAKNPGQSRLSSEKLKKPNACHNRAISTMPVLEELISLAKEMDAVVKCGEELGITDDEITFDDALAVNESAGQTVLIQAKLLCTD